MSTRYYVPCCKDITSKQKYVISQILSQKFPFLKSKYCLDCNKEITTPRMLIKDETGPGHGGLKIGHERTKNLK